MTTMQRRQPRPLRQQQLVDEAVLAYVDWREESATLRASYRRWATATGEDGGGAYTAYRAAIDREEAAAHHYASLTRRVSDLLTSDHCGRETAPSCPAPARARGAI
jgi:hypothetical protein